MSHKLVLGLAYVAAAAGIAMSTHISGAAVPATPATPAAPATMPAMTQPTPPARAGRGAAAPASLSSAMGEMNRMLIAIKAESTDATKIEQTLKDIATLERDVAISKLQTPPNVNRMANADDKAKATASYRTMMNGLTRTLLDLEDAVNDKKPDDIKKALTQLDVIEKQGHTEFNVRVGG